jgi:outer membrane receptor protein involved in Fe transport
LPRLTGLRRLRRPLARGLAFGVASVFVGSLAVAQDAEPEPVAQPDAAEAAKPAPKPSRPGIEEIVIRGSESDAAGDFAAADSVTGFSAEDLAALGAQDIGDLAGFTPNLEIVTSGSTTPTFFIRGVGLNDFNANSTGAVAIYQDDVAINAPALQLGTLYDVDQVNVLRGPQGTGPARNASAGAIKIYSRKPSGELGGFLRSDLGNYDFRDFEGAIEAPLYEDMLATRLAFRFTERDGTMKNRCGNALPVSQRATTPPAGVLRAQGKTATSSPWSICGEPVLSGEISPIAEGLPVWVNDLGNWAARGTLLFEPTLDSTILVNAHGARRDEYSRLGVSYGTTGIQFPQGVPGPTINGLLGGTQGIGAGYQAPEVLRRWIELAPCRAPRPSFPGGNCIVAGGQNLLAAAQIKTANELAQDLDEEPWRGDFNRVGPTTNDTWGGYVNGEVALPGGMQLKSVTGYDHYERVIDLDLDFSPETLFQILTQDSGWQAVEDVRLEGVFGEELPVSWNIGGWFLREGIDVNVKNDLGILAIFGAAERDYTQDVWSAAGYAGLSFDFWQDFTLDGGFRYNWERKKMDYLLILGTGDTQPAAPDESWNEPTGTIRLTYRFREDTHAYWKYTRGWKPGTYNATSSAQGVTIAEPETIDAFEAGVRGSWLEGRMSLDFSTFYYNYENYQLFTAQQFAGGQPEFVILNAPKAEVYGAEIDAMVRPWIGAFVNVRFGWLESQFLDFVQVQQDRIQDPITGDQIIVNKQLNNNGNSLLNSPQFKVSLTGEQTIPLGRWGSLTARYDGVWTDTTYYNAQEGFGIPNKLDQQILPKDTIAQGPYWLHNLRLGYRTPNGKIEIAGWVRNLTNEAYKTFGFDGNTFNNTTIYFVGDPRTVGGTLVINF